MDKLIQFLPYLIPIFLLELILIILALVDLVRRERTHGPKWIWALVIIFGELLGPIIYFIFGRED